MFLGNKYLRLRNISTRHSPSRRKFKASREEAAELRDNSTYFCKIFCRRCALPPSLNLFGLVLNVWVEAFLFQDFRKNEICICFSFWYANSMNMKFTFSSIFTSVGQKDVGGFQSPSVVVLYLSWDGMAKHILFCKIRHAYFHGSGGATRVFPPSGIVRGWKKKKCVTSGYISLVRQNKSSKKVKR